jgi:hypothetical protein
MVLLLQTQLGRMGVPTLVDELFPTHRNGQGLGLGEMTMV